MLLLFFPTPPIKPPSPATYTSVPIYDEFDNPRGEFVNYTASDVQQNLQLHKQQHVDLRSFINYDTVTSITMLYLDLFSMVSLDLQIIAELESDALVRAGERWTNGTIAIDPGRKNWRVLSMPCSVGLNITQSVFNN